jgi:hypothetical protein
MESRPFREELAQQPVRVFVRAPLPRTLGMGKVDVHLRLLGEEPVLAHFLPLVVGEGAAELSGQRPPFAGKGPPHGHRVLRLQRHQHREPGGAFHPGAQGRGVRMAHQQVALPMPGHGAIRHLRGTLVNADHVLNRPRRAAHLAGPTKPVPAAELAGQLPLEGAAGQHIEIGINGFVRDPHGRVIRIPLR